jgi:putative transposase
VGLTDSLHFLIVCRYIERNPVEARLVQRAEDWRWSSARQRGQVDIELPMDDGPMPLPTDWLAILNSERDLATSDLTLALKTRGQTPSTLAF